MLFVAWKLNSLYFTCRQLVYVTCHLWFQFINAQLWIVGRYNFSDQMKKGCVVEWLFQQRFPRILWYGESLLLQKLKFMYKYDINKQVNLCKAKYFCLFLKFKNLFFKMVYSCSMTVQLELFKVAQLIYFFLNINNFRPLCTRDFTFWT